MADIIIPPLVDGNVLSSSAVSTAIYSPGSSASFETINGALDNTNRAAGWDVTSGQVQSRALSGGRSVGATTNVDLFGNTFGNFELVANDEAHLYRPLPGTSQTFYLPYDCSLVVFTWSILLQASQTASPRARARLFLDGIVNTQVMFDLPRSSPDRERARSWTGHHFESTMLKGWHSFSLRVAGEAAAAAQTIRVRCRHLDYVYFK